MTWHRRHSYEVGLPIALVATGVVQVADLGSSSSAMRERNPHTA
jgi:hypothetical protein